MTRTELESAQYWLRQNRLWVERCGGNLSGYLAQNPGQDPAQTAAIYEADMATLRKSAERVAYLLTRQPRSRRKENA